MKTSLSVLFALLLSATSSVGEDSRLILKSVVDMVELEYTDSCKERATATWEELMGMKNGLSNKLKRDKSVKLLVQNNRYNVKAAFTKDALGPDDDIMRRKVKLLLQPGDLSLDTKEWIRLVEYADNAQNQMRFATNYDCGLNVSCSLREFHISYGRQQDLDEGTLKRMKHSWEKNLPDLDVYLEHILPLVRNASKDYNTVEEYWDFLVEYEGAILKARELWDNIKPLYTKLHKYAALKLMGEKAVGSNLPVHLLRSLNGDDWSNIIEKLLPEHPAAYQNVHANLRLQNLGGINVFKSAAKLINDLNLGNIKGEIWTNSVFNSSCPPTLVDWCEPNNIRVVTCKDVSIGNYLDAHEAAMKIAYKQNTATYSNNSYVIREAPRLSAIYEAIPGFLSLLSLSPHALGKNDLFSLETFNYNANHHRLVLQLILALRDLPKLNFYLAADEWRIKVLMGSISSSKISESWSEFRREFSLLETSDADFLSDPYILLNKPFIGKFMGLILKYQIYQSFAEELQDDNSDLLKQVASNSERLNDIMIQGYTYSWPELVSDLLAKRENGLEYTALTDYYRLLDDFLDVKFDPTLAEVNIIDDYVDPVPVEEEDKKFDLDGAVSFEEPYSEPPVIDDDNSIEGSDLNPDTETTTVSVLEVRKPIDQVANEEEPSYDVYWWIGIAVAIAIVVILIAIIARKRYNHRKQLERQRRENSRA